MFVGAAGTDRDRRRTPHRAANEAEAQPVGVVAGGDQQLGADRRADAV